jgi:DNA-binding IclR family transcriptional regulator
LTVSPEAGFSVMTAPDPLAAAILAALAAGSAAGMMSLPRLARRLGLPASVLLRQLTQMGDAMIGAQAGPGWVRVVRAEDRWMVHLTAAGRGVAALQQAGGATQPPARSV